MNIKNLRKENLSGLKNQLSLFYKERFKLLLDKTSGAEFTKNHLFKKTRKNIARVLTLITKLEKKNI